MHARIPWLAFPVLPIAAGLLVAAGHALWLAAALAGLLVIAVGLTRPREFTLWAIPLLILVPAFVRFHGGGPGITPQRVLFALGLVALAVTVRRDAFLPSRFVFWASCFAVWVFAVAVVHGAHSAEINRAINYTAEAGLPVLLIIWAVRTRDDMSRLLTRLTATIAVASALAIFEVLNGRYLFAAHTNTFFHAPARHGILRAQSVFAHPLFLAVAAATLIPVALNQVLNGERRRFNISAVLVMSVALVLTQGRGEILAALIGVAVLASLRRGASRMSLIATLALLLVTLSVAPGGFGALANAVQNPTIANSGDTVSYRQQLLDQTLHYSLHHPLGAGAGNSSALPLTASLNGQTTDLSISIDNAYAKYLLELGWPGLLLFLAMLATVIAATRRLLGIERSAPGLVAALVVFLAASATVATFTVSQLALIFAAIVGIVFSVLSLSAGEALRDA